MLEDLPKEWNEIKELEDEIKSGKIPKKFELMKNNKTGRPTFSAEKDVGLELLRLEIIKHVTKNIETDPLKLPDNWYRSDSE